MQAKSGNPEDVKKSILKKGHFKKQEMKNNLLSGKLSFSDIILKEPNESPPSPLDCECGDIREAYGLFGKWTFDYKCPACLVADEIQERWERNVESVTPEPMFPIPKAFQGVSLENYQCPPGDRMARKTLEDWYPQSGGLYIHGNPGSGKTHLAYSMAHRFKFINESTMNPHNWPKHLVNLPDDYPQSLYDKIVDKLHQRYPSGKRPGRGWVEAVDVPEMLQKIKKQFNENRGGEEILRILMDCDLLVLDDLGSEHITDWTVEQVFSIMNHRMKNKKPMIITSNYCSNELEKQYTMKGNPMLGKRLSSRVSGACKVIQVNAPDYRPNLMR